MHKHEKPIIHEHGISGYDVKDVQGKPLAVYFIILTLVTIASAITALVAWKAWESRPSSGSVAVLPVAEQRALPELPLLQPRPQVDIKALHASEAAKLNRYAWIDKPAQIVQIPISRAMDLVAERGLPHGPEAHVPGQGQMSAPAAPAATAGL
ncbi:MAG: hypothetical protein HUU46_04270 [Candidatus Hydrogenedentes bacterium]|nr:hypothetical protein [Candidatus Hydrogenedentota bacterium]